MYFETSSLLQEISCRLREAPYDAAFIDGRSCHLRFLVPCDEVSYIEDAKCGSGSNWKGVFLLERIFQALQSISIPLFISFIRSRRASSMKLKCEMYPCADMMCNCGKTQKSGRRQLE